MQSGQSPIVRNAPFCEQLGMQWRQPAGRCERECGKIETPLPELLADVEARWPLDQKERFGLAMFIALHVLRTPAFSDWLEVKRAATLEDYRDQFSNKRKYERWRELMLSDGERAKRILSMVNKISTIFGCMNWTLLRFDEPLLITSDHPVCPVPIIEGGADRAIHPMPDERWMNTIEVRFPLSPRLALLATWHMSEPQSSISGTWEQISPFAGLCASGRRGSNPRPSAWEADALPTELRPRRGKPSAGVAGRSPGVSRAPRCSRPSSRERSAIR
jgi:hypothetical protein